MTRPVRARVALDALRSNLELARRTAPHSRILAVVKANAYGHGLVPVAQALEAADAFGVAGVEEALFLRQAGIKKPIVLLEGFFHGAELDEVIRHRLSLVLHAAHQLEALAAAAPAAPLRVWVKLDTGMHRLGFAPGELPSVLQRLQALEGVELAGLMTHFACADDRADPATRRQLERFDALAGGLEGEHSLANSAALLGWPQTHAGWVRPGLMLYGISPFVDSLAVDHGLRPAMTLETELIAIRDCAAGDAVGYGGAWVCPEAMPVGVAAIGYGDGYPRHAPAGTPVLVDGRPAQLVGRVSMDMITLDLRGLPEARVGSRVSLWGEGLPVEHIARAAGTIPYELVCAVTARVPLVYE
ncbi:alanine racemase [Thiohalobacter thiocyanaticus]|uniref:Alanine racemase n=1 Tax=Thiohalobacter thiocyanaticus TaxID=585455 RepID=A0A1Z4VTX8_9GAMM|nr:alanine racemase [Thiohalobacter thiocyanaticus]BAZ94852.1 alanine racemase [Thiohalobacter thiocyanaticus]